jgi:hypothetical protein
MSTFMELSGAAFLPTVKPVVTDTVTEEIWRARAGKNLWVKTQVAQTASREDGLLPVEFLADDDVVGYGRLESVNGTGDTFVATVLILGADMEAAGNDTNAAELADADIGETLKGAGDGTLKIESGGFGRVVGGNKQDIRMAHNGILNIR